MEDEIKLFIRRLSQRTLTDENIIEEKLKTFQNLEERRLRVLLNHEFFAGQEKLTDYLRKASDDEYQGLTQPIRKRLYKFIASYISNQYLYLIDHAKYIFEQLVSLTWKEKGTMKQHAIRPLSIIIQVYDQDFLLSNEILNPELLHAKIIDLGNSQNKCHMFTAECWYFLAVIQSKFPHKISPRIKKNVQEQIFRVLKKYVAQQKYLNAIAQLNRSLAKALKENYLQESNLGELFRYVITLIPAIKATYAVHISALQLLSQRKQLFHPLIMGGAIKLFATLRDGSNHKNKDYKIKCLEVLIEIVEEIVKGISSNKQKNRPIFLYIYRQINEDLQSHLSKDKKENQEQKKGLNFLTVVRLLSIISPLYYEYEGKEKYKIMFDGIIKKCAKMIKKENNYYSTSKGHQIMEVLYAQKTLYSFILSLAHMIEHLDTIDYMSANLLEEIFIAAIKESAYFLPKYLPDLWLAIIQLIMSIYTKGPIFGKWSKKVISESLKECLDSKKMNVENDDEYIKMITKASQLWRSILSHTSWNTGPQNEFTQLLVSNIEYLILNLNCGYRTKGQGDDQQDSFENQSQQQEIVQIFYLANERIQILKIQDYQYLSSLSLLFHQVLDCIDPSLYNKRILNFYPQIIDRIKQYPKCLPLLRTLRSLNQYILKNNYLKYQLSSQVEYAKEFVDKMAKFFHFTVEKVYKFQEQYFYELMKVLLSFSEQVYLSNSHRIIKSHLPKLLIKSLDMGQQVVSLANAALRCTQRLFKAQKQISQSYLLPVISSLEKYINLAISSEREQFKSQLFLFEQTISRKQMSDSVLTFLGSLGGICHNLVDNKNKDHISWDYDCNLKIEIDILKENFPINLARILDRICWLSVNGKDQIKIVSCELLHAKITYVIEEIVSNKMDKDNISTFLDRILPTILAISSNSSHPSQQLIHTLLIQVIHFFANTKQPNSPDVQVILKHLLSLYNKSQDMGFIASKCLSEFVRWHIKQQPQKSGDVPILKALINNIWSLVGNKNAREGIITFLVKLLKIIHRQDAIMRYYSIQFGSLLISLARYHNKLQPQFKYLIEKYTACIKRYMKFLIIPEGGRRYKKTPTIHIFLDQLYKNGFFSIYQQQRQASFIIWIRILRQNHVQLGYSQAEFLKVRAQKEKKYLFGNSYALDFKQVEETDFCKDSWRLIGLGQIWLRMLQQKIFLQSSLIQFLDLECVYIVSFVSFLHFIKNAQENGLNEWTDDIQQSIVLNLKTFLRLIKAFSPERAFIIVGKFYFNLDQTNFSQRNFHSFLLNVVFRPEEFIKNLNRDILSGNQLKEYLWNMINYFQVRELEDNYKATPIEKAMDTLEREIKFSIKAMVQYFCRDELASERTILSIMEFIKTAYKYEVENNLGGEQNGLLNTLLSKLLEEFHQCRPERQYCIITFLLTFSYKITIKFVCFQVQNNSHIFQRYEKYFIDFIIKNWQRVNRPIIKICLTSINNIKMVYVLLLKLSQQQKQIFLTLADEPTNDILLRDLLKINFLLAKQLDFHTICDKQYKQSRSMYLKYLQRLALRGLKGDNSLQIHEETLYLCGIIINKRLDIAKTIDLTGILNGLNVKYVPLGVSKLQSQQKQEQAMQYFKILRNLIVISQQFCFIRHFMVQLKDEGVSESRADIINNYIEDCVRTCFTLQGEKPLQWSRWLIQFYWDRDCDYNSWLNFRLIIIEKIFRKAVSYIKLEHLQRLYEENIRKLNDQLEKKLITHQFNDFILDMQLKKGAFLLVQLLYGNLPRHEKKEGVKSQNQIHKFFIKYAIAVAKQTLDSSLLRLLREHDQRQAQKGLKGRAMRVYREYNCYAYNCLVVLFISTQSNPKHFTTFLFQNNKQALWNNLVDTIQQQFNFEIETSFKVIQPNFPLHNKIKEIKSKIEKTYFQCSLYIVPQQNIPMGNQQIAEEDEGDEEKEVVPIKNAHNIMQNTVIEEDIINKHPCMMNLLRVVDFLNANFPQEFPCWMKPIQTYLESRSISLAQTIFLLKLVLNRPTVFHQQVWAKHLLNYLSLDKTGSNFIHYFYRDVLKRYLKFLPALKLLPSDTKKINIVIMKIVKCLPHQNLRVFSDNIDMLEELFRVPGVYVLKSTIKNMLKSEKEEKDKHSWRMCAVIILKLCIISRVPVLSEEEYEALKDSPARFNFYYKEIKNHLKFVYEFLVESSKQYRVAAAGFLGEFLSFIFTSSLDEQEKKEHFKSVSKYLVTFLEKGSNRSTKEKFSLALEKISMRFPQLLADEHLFSIFLDSLSQFTGAQRCAMLLAFKQFSKSLLAFSQLSLFANFFVRFKAKHREIISDTNEVKVALLQILNLCTDHRLLKIKEIFYSLDFTLNEMSVFRDINEEIAYEYYQLLIRLKKYLIDPEAKEYEISAVLLGKVEKRLIEGLSSKFESSAKMLFEEFEKEAANMADPNDIDRFIRIMHKLYDRESEGEWLINVVPIILTLCRKSSNYSRPLTQTKLEENMLYYDWDFRNFKINDASLPYTPFTAFADRRQGASQAGGASQGHNLRGMIRATQNNSNMSQQQQIFTLLESISSQQSSQLQGSQGEGGEEEVPSEEKYHKINDLFRNKRRRNEAMDSFKQSNLGKISPAVQFVEDKIRFVKNSKAEEGFAKKFLRKEGRREKVKRGAILRAYKIGELPNIEISLKNLFEPLIFLSAKDSELASEVFLQLVVQLCAARSSYCLALRALLSGLLLGSARFTFSFVSTLEKCLISICQRSKASFELSLKEVALRSSTLDYAVIFTEENIIQLFGEVGEGGSAGALEGGQERLAQQWYDLAEYYQILSELDMVESVILKIAEERFRPRLLEALRRKKDGELGEARRLIDALLEESTSSRLALFLERERVDCSVLLSEWEEICAEGAGKVRGGAGLSAEEVRMFALAVANSAPERRAELLGLLPLEGDRFEYEQALVSVLRDNELDKARFHALNAREVFRREWEKVSSFAYKSKHELLQSLQKNYEVTEFLELYRRPEAREKDCEQLFARWSSRRPDEVFDDNMTWIQILSSRTVLGGLLGSRWGLSAERMARHNIDWLVQVVDGMIAKDVLGYAENVIRTALRHHQRAREFNWPLYESIAQLKLMQTVKRRSLQLSDYEIVPKLIQREMDKHGFSSAEARFKLLAIRNQYLEGFLEVARGEVEGGVLVMQAYSVFRNYEEVKKGLRLGEGEQVDRGFHKAIHFRYALFLESLLSLVRGKFEVREVRESLEKLGLATREIASKFIAELVYSIKLLDLQGSSALEYEEGQQLFSMILKLVKLVQGEPGTVGKHFEDAVNDRQIPKWIFLYFLPQIIKKINDFDVSLHFGELFDYLLTHYPEALVYPFNCAYPRLALCRTELTKYLFEQLHARMGRYFELVDNLFLLQHPELRLKDLLTRYHQHGEAESANEELRLFIADNPLLGKYNQRFNEGHRAKITQLLELKERGAAKELSDQIKAVIASLDPAKASLAKYFSKLSDGSYWFEDYNCSDWARLEVPGTAYCQFEEPHPWSRVHIESFESALLTLTSIRRPKRVSLLGSDEKVYMLLVKGGEDVRLDQRVEQLFELVNRILAHHSDTSRKQLEVSRFEVVPMKPMFGVFEWVDKSRTLRAFLEAELRQAEGRPEANLATENKGFAEFHRYFKKLCPNSDDRHVWHRALMGRPEGEVVRNFGKCEAGMPYGLLRRGLERLAKNYDSFLHLKNKFLSNYSAICLATYLFGIGDRHLENFLVQTSTGKLVMIDFGYSFGASLELPIPELIPFRFTKCLRELAAPAGVEGAFRKCMVACFEALGKRMHLIVDYCDVFVDDPLMEWVWVSRRQLHAQPRPSPSFSLSQEAPEKRLFSSKIKVVENKLRGHHPRQLLELLLNDSRHKSAQYLETLKGAIWKEARSRAAVLSGEEVVEELLSLATDKNILGRSYLGLNLFV